MKKKERRKKKPLSSSFPSFPGSLLATGNWKKVFRIFALAQTISCLHLPQYYTFWTGQTAAVFTPSSHHLEGMKVSVGLSSEHALPCAHAATATSHFLEGLSHLQTPESIYKGINDRVAHDKNQVGVEVRSIAKAVWVVGARNDEDKVEEKGCPADDEDTQQNSNSDSPFHAGALAGDPIHGEGCNALDM